MSRREARTLYVVLAFFVATLLMVDTTRATVVATYPKKVCKVTSSSQITSGGAIVKKPLFWGVVSFRWCERRFGKWQGAVINHVGPTTRVGVTGHGKWWSWHYGGETKRVVKCVQPGPWGCSYLRMKLWHEFWKRGSIWIPGDDDNHTMKFGLRVGNGIELWQ